MYHGTSGGQRISCKIQFSFNYMGPGGQTQVIRLNNMCLDI